MKNIRQQVFETNSSSSHSISICSSSQTYSTIHPDENGVITLIGGEFGCGYEEYYDSETKANYCAVDMFNDESKIEMLKKVICDHTGAKEVVLDFDPHECYSNSHNWSYVDHQSQGTSSDAFENESTLKNFIFGRGSYLIIDNDNY